MRLSDFDYHLPAENIAQEPCPERDRSRLLVVPRAGGGLSEMVFADLPRLLRPGDLLVVNDTRVRQLRVEGKKATGGKAELTFVHRLGLDEWECLARARGLAPGSRIDLPEGVSAEIIGESGAEVRTGPDRGAPLWRVRVTGGSLEEMLARRGRPPLPPYIRREPDADPSPDVDRYQTVYAGEGEAAAAPTAGFHFSERLLAEVEAAGVKIARVRLDVSFGTFAPVRVERIEDHAMHPESFALSEAAAGAVNQTRAAGGRVIAVGTTVARTLEHCADETGRVNPTAGETSLFIYPGYRFKAVDAMITNFHLPRSTLIMLVSAFAGRERILAAYAEAVARGFRFLSYGDAMVIL